MQPGVPLWKLAPTRDESGKLLCDFMVLIPRLKLQQPGCVGKAQNWIAGVLNRHQEVVFANMDLKLNLLWVSHRYRAGLMLEIVGAIRLYLPEAVLVAHMIARPGR
ncbi:MAG: hypothetical protein AB1591_01915 [Pseudomonadota bacterium]